MQEFIKHSTFLNPPASLEADKKNRWFKVYYDPDFAIPSGLRTLNTLQMFADHYSPRQTIPWDTINQGLLQPKGELYPIQTIINHRSRDQLLEFRTSFYETISSECFVQWNLKHTQYSREHWYWRDSNSQPRAPKASTVSIELTWLTMVDMSILSIFQNAKLCTFSLA